MPRASRLLLSCAAVGALLALAPAARAQEALKFGACGEGTAPHVTCASLKVPRDYGNPDAGAFVLHIAKSPATDPQHRIGSLFMNFGGPGRADGDLLRDVRRGPVPGAEQALRHDRRRSARDR